MEKIVYLLWRDTKISQEEFSLSLRTDVADKLLAIGARGLQVNVADKAVESASKLRQVNNPPPFDGFLSLWVDSAIEKLRRPFDDVIEAAVARIAAYLVTESQPIRNTRYPPILGERTAGFSQLALLKRLPHLAPDAWLDIWHNHHTQVAIDTQDTFLYVQNVVVRSLTAAAPAYDAIVEECFPAAAMTDPYAFFNAVGDEDKFQRNVGTMMESCKRFIDLEKIDVIPSSQYIMKTPAT